MFYTYPSIYPDEIFYSYISRFHKYSGNSLISQSLKELLNTTYIKANNFASNLNYFCSNFFHDEYTPKFFINNHTIFPIYKPFLTSKVCIEIEECMKSGNPGLVQLKLGNTAGSICKNGGIKICPSCIDEDRMYYGEAYIHRIHQVPGYFICTKHQKYLYDIQIMNTSVYDSYIDIEDYLSGSSIKSNTNSQYPRRLKPKLLQLSRDIEYFFNNNINDLDVYYFKDKYNTALYTMGLSSLSKKIHQSELIQKITAFHSEDFLNLLDSNINITTDWFKNIAKDSYKGIIHPLRHILLIEFLAKNVLNFIQNFERHYNPFGVGPWPCLNPVVTHYKELVITDCTISRRSSYLKPIGIFKCDCGYIYSRSGPDKDANDKYVKKQVREYGDIWEYNLKNHILSGITSMRELGRLMECDSKTIRSYAKELGIIDLLTTNAKVEVKKRNNAEIEQEYKNKILIYLTDHPRCTRSELKKNCEKQVSWLLNHNPLWIKEMQPKPDIYNKPYKTNPKFIDWIKRDNELYEKVNELINIIKNNNLRKRLTKSLICRALGLRSNSLNPHLLPRTCKLIDSNIESVIEFQKYRVILTIQKLYSQNEKLKYHRVVAKAGLNQTKLSKELIQFIHSEISKYN